MTAVQHWPSIAGVPAATYEVELETTSWSRALAQTMRDDLHGKAGAARPTLRLGCGRDSGGGMGKGRSSTMRFITIEEVSPLDAGQGGELLIAEVLVGGEVGGGDADQVVGVSEEPFGVANLGNLR